MACPNSHSWDSGPSHCHVLEIVVSAKLRWSLTKISYVAGRGVGCSPWPESTLLMKPGGCDSVQSLPGILKLKRVGGGRQRRPTKGGVANRGYWRDSKLSIFSYFLPLPNVTEHTKPWLTFHNLIIYIADFTCYWQRYGVLNYYRFFRVVWEGSSLFFHPSHSLLRVLSVSENNLVIRRSSHYFNSHQAILLY